MTNLIFSINPGLLGGIIAAAVAALILIILLIVLFTKKKGPKKIKISEDFMNDIINKLGGIENIIEVLVDNARLKIKVKDTKLPDYEGLKSLSGQGVFITGDYVKLLFKFDSKLIKREIDSRL